VDGRGGDVAGEVIEVQMAAPHDPRWRLVAALWHLLRPWHLQHRAHRHVHLTAHEKSAPGLNPVISSLPTTTSIFQVRKFMGRATQEAAGCFIYVDMDPNKKYAESR